MRFFDRFQSAPPEPERESRACMEFREACEKFNRSGESIWMECEPNRTFSFPKWKFQVRDGCCCFLPDIVAEQENDDTLSRALPLELRRALIEAELLPAERKGCPAVGVLDEYEIPALRLRISGARTAETIFTISNTGGNLKKLSEWGFPSKPLYNLFDCPEDRMAVRLLDGGALLPQTALGYQVWREDGRLAFQQRENTMYARARSIKLGYIPVSEIGCFRLVGEIRTEQRVTGGKTRLKARDQNLGEFLLCGTEIHTSNLESLVEVEQEPIRLETLEYDERSVELRVDHDGVACTLSFGAEAMEVFEQLIPDKQEMEPAQPSGREPTPAEQLEILANLVDRGYLTRAEFDKAKPCLLAKL